MKIAPQGADYPETPGTRSSVAFCTGETGDAREALRLFREWHLHV